MTRSWACCDPVIEFVKKSYRKPIFYTCNSTKGAGKPLNTQFVGGVWSNGKSLGISHFVVGLITKPDTVSSGIKNTHGVSRRLSIGEWNSRYRIRDIRNLRRYRRIIISKVIESSGGVGPFRCGSDGVMPLINHSELESDFLSSFNVSFGNSIKHNIFERTV